MAHDNEQKLDEMTRKLGVQVTQTHDYKKVTLSAKERKTKRMIKFIYKYIY